MLSENHFLANSSNIHREIISEEIFLIGKTWANKKDDIMQTGKELIRLLIPLAKSGISEITTIIDDISSLTTPEGIPMYVKLLTAPSFLIQLNTFTTCFYTCINIPPLMERMLIFLLNEVKRNNYIRYITWIFKKFNIVSDCDKTILVDIARYIVTTWSMVKIKSDITPRWLIIGYLLKACKNEIINGEIKQAIFYDWLFFNKERDLATIEPGLLVIFNSLKEFSEISMELVEFLDIYSENFSPGLKTKIRENIGEAFRHSEIVQMIPSLRILLKEEKITKEIKNTFEQLIKSKEDSNDKTNELKFEKIDISISNLPEKSQEYDINKPKILTNEFFMDNSIQDLINPITLKNFVTFRSINTFRLLLEDFCKEYVNKSKSSNKLSAPNDIPLHFAHFYLNSFKDELIQQIKPIDENKVIHLHFIEFIINKQMEKKDKEVVLLANSLFEICNLHKGFASRIIVTLTKNIKIYGKEVFNVFNLIYKDGRTVLKEFFTTCLDELNLDLMNFFIEKGLSLFNPIFRDDMDLLNFVIIYSGRNNLNKIITDIEAGKFFLFEKNLVQVISKLNEMNVNEQSRYWEVITAHDLAWLNLSEFLVKLSKILKENFQKINFNGFTFFKGLCGIAKKHKNKNLEFYPIFSFPFQLCENIYDLFLVLNLDSNSICLIMQEFFKNNKDNNNTENFTKLLKELIKLDKLNSGGLFDRNYIKSNFAGIHIDI
jgi:hypothetical protein